jgi:hypothetical protein
MQANIVDILYIGSLLYGFSLFPIIDNLSIFHYAIIVLYISLSVDWRSARIVSFQTSNISYFVADAITVLNYISLFNAVYRLSETDNSDYFILFVHYGVLFFIYSSWNIFVLYSNYKNTKKTKMFFQFYSIIEIFIIVALSVYLFYFYSIASGDLMLFIISTIHFSLLSFWIIFTHYERK